MRTTRKTNAFTLLEIMLVVGIIALLLGMAISHVSGTKTSTAIVVAETEIRTFSTQLGTYEMSAGQPPTTEQGLQALYKRPTTKPQPKRWTRLITKEPIDPWGNRYIYRMPGQHNTDSFDISSNGPDRKEGTEDDITNWENQQ